MTLEEELQTLNKRLQTVKSDIARREARRDLAKEELSRLEEEMVAKGFPTLEALRKRVQELAVEVHEQTAALGAELSVIEEQLRSV